MIKNVSYGLINIDHSLFRTVFKKKQKKTKKNKTRRGREDGGSDAGVGGRVEEG